ncbi:T9SS type A sorting domain-containing protein [Winogradskyella pacifica]|uniref:T9SS type A sorting domain-containing protein n=1 Tax=Winogradskyella pacifica TaxID=664642 RepID=UPI0015CBEFFC|nr:T9SS type A sorting domain-containing protein [Winogradskyella pacifica]
MNTILSFVSSKKVMTTFLLLLSVLSFSQTVTDVYPTRVTHGSAVTIIGTGFSSNPNVALSGISISTINRISDTQMSFEITRAFTSSSTSGNLVVGGTDTTVEIQFIQARNFNVSNRKIKEIYTNLNADKKVDRDGNLIVRGGFWNSKTSSVLPDDKHELLGFKTNDDTIFSTGVDDAALATGLGHSGFITQEFKAYSTNGVSGKTHPSFFMEMADLIDGYVGGQESSSPGNAVANLDAINGLKVIDVLIDGKNGLELGTGITNFNTNASVKFFSGNGQPGVIGDINPDLLITQIADPGSRDYYYYEDELGNIVGTPLGVSMSGATELSKWKVDFFSYPSNQDFADAVPTNRWSSTNGERGIRMAALKLEDFDINNIDGTTGYIGDINNINMAAGGTADIAFLAYNTNSFDIKAPLADAILPQYICDVSVTGNTATFTVNAYIENEAGDGTILDSNMTYEWRKNNIKIPGETNFTYEITGITADDLGTYSVKLYNGEQGGSIILPVTLSEGGAPTTWNGSTWTSSYTVADKERSLIFGTDFNEDEGNLDQTVDLVGCDCVVAAGANVIIKKDQKMVLYNEITVNERILIPAEGIDIPAGTFTLENNASLVQINDVVNSGKINVKRQADNLNQYDYVYWSSPVAEFDIAGIPGSNKYEWNPQIGNDNTDDSTVGDWVSANGFMSVGKGYIARVPSSANVTTTFNGVPNNGDIDIEIFKTPLAESSDMAGIDKHWNLIGNPYPSAIDAIKFLTYNSSVIDGGIDGSVYLWTHTRPASSSEDDPFYDNDDTYGLNYGDQYIAYNAMGNSDPSDEFKGKIASGQGFFVQVEDGFTGSPSVTFNNTMRHDNYEAYNNDEFYRGTVDTAVALEKQLVWLSLANEDNHAMSTLIGYAEGATEGKDRLYDAYTNNEGFNLYSLITEDEKLVIQGLPLPFVDTNTVPLGVELTQSGIYTIAIGNVKGSLFVDREQAIYLEDTYTNVTHDLRASPYTFTGEAGEFNDRFVLRYTPSVTLSVNENSAATTFAYVSNAMFHVKSNSNLDAIEIFDMNGKQIINYTIEDNTNSFDTQFAFANGIYIAAIKLDNGSVVTKKLIN